MAAPAEAPARLRPAFLGDWDHLPPTTGATLLPVARAPGCVTCGGPVARASWTQLPLLRHAGYGAAERSVVERCVDAACGSVRRVAVDAVDPRPVERP